MSDDIQNLRRQLQQLGELHAAGALDDAQYQASKARLERKLVDAVVTGPGGAPAAVATGPATAAAPSSITAPTAASTKATAAAASPQPATRPSRALLASLSVFVVAVAAAGYAWKGSPAFTGLTSAPQVVGAEGGPGSHDTAGAQIAAMVDKLAQRLKENPDDAQGWVMLARSYSVLDRYAEAVPAYVQALKLGGEDATLLADYADALGMVNNRTLGPDAEQAIQRALKVDPDNFKALSLAGTAAFNRSDYVTAVRHWERLVQVAPADSPFLQDVHAGIAEARQRGNLGPARTPPAAQGSAQQAPTAAAPPQAAAPNPHADVQVAQAAPQSKPGAPAAAAPGGATVSGTVTLSKAMAAQASPGDTVFVFARAAEGPRMPLAILRKQVKDLPLEFKLDDSMAMAPAFKLSSFPNVVVGARISKTGEAMPQKGDLTGSTAPVAVGSTGLKIEINQIVSP